MKHHFDLSRSRSAVEVLDPAATRRPFSQESSGAKPAGRGRASHDAGNPERMRSSGPFGTVTRCEERIEIDRRSVIVLKFLLHPITEI